MSTRPGAGEIDTTVDRATELANQMLALAKVEQLRQQAPATGGRLAPVVRAVALDLAPLIADTAGLRPRHPAGVGARP
jgi:two-component system sensor histidine kinase TctE